MDLNGHTFRFCLADPRLEVSTLIAKLAFGGEIIKTCAHTQNTVVIQEWIQAPFRSDNTSL